MCGVQRITENLIHQQFRNMDSISESTRITIFKIADLLIGLGSLMICTHDLTVFTKKETINYCKSFGYGGTSTLDNHFYHSNGVSVPTEEASQ
jgi:hypothetical protein